MKILSVSGIALLSMAFAAVPAQAQAPNNQFVVEAAIDAIPLDLEVTPDGAMAVVRANISALPLGASNAKVSIWRTDSAAGAQLFPPGAAVVGRGNLITAGGLLYTFSDAVAVTNSRAVAIGSADTDLVLGEDTTYVDILALSSAVDPPTATVLSTTALPGVPASVAGLAHDVAITPNGSRAVVSHRNFIHVFNLTTGALVQALNIGSAVPIPAFGIGGIGPCDPGGSRNSVAVTDSRAVVTVRRPAAAGPYSRTWVYVVDIRAAIPTVVLEQQLPITFGGEDQDQTPHDLAITPDGTRAFVTAYGTVGLVDLINDSLIAALTDRLNTRTWRVNEMPDLWDSVELSNTHAVVLANRDFGSFIFRGRVEVFPLNQTGPILATSQDYTVPNTSGFDPAWDVVLSSDGQVAALRTLLHNGAVVNVPGTTSTFLWLTGASTGNGLIGACPPPVNMNDAVGISQTYTDPTGSHRWGAFIGYSSVVPPVTRVGYYDLAQPLAAITGTEIPVNLSATNEETRPADLEMSPDRREVLLRLSSTPDELNPAIGGRDWYRWTTYPPAIVGFGLGGSGVCVGAESLREQRTTAVSISYDPSVAAGGWIHIANANL